MSDLPVAVRRARAATAAVFFLNGFGFANWVPRLAEVKARVGLDEAGFGLTLLMLAIGALVAMPAVGAAVGRYGSRRPTAASLLLFMLAPVAWSLAPGPVLLGLGFLAIGAMAGALDVAMNAQAVDVERAAGRPVMSALHGMFSLGGLTGALASGVIIGLGLPLPLHMALVALVTLPPGLLACAFMLADEAPAPAGGPAFALPGRGLIPIGVIAFAALLIEGAIADWSAIYLRESLDADARLAAWAFAAFQLTMAGGRFMGDRLIQRFGRVRLARMGGLLAALGVAGLLLLGQPWAAIAGFALVGLGIAATFPMTISAAAEGESRPGHAVAAIATLGYTGFLIGPPTIGGLASLISLPLALFLLPALAVLIAILAPTLRRPPRP